MLTGFKEQRLSIIGVDKPRWNLSMELGDEFTVIPIEGVSEGASGYDVMAFQI